MGSFSIFRSFNAKAPWRVDFYTYTCSLFNWVPRNLQNLSNPYIYILETRPATTSPSYSLSSNRFNLSLSPQMAFSKSMAFLAIALVLVPMATFALDLPAVPPAIAGEICKRVECGKGTCKFNNSYEYTCECDKGWKRTADGNDDLKFLPCVIPNCTLEYNDCQAPPPVPDYYSKFPNNVSVFDPCRWVYCGEGTCVTNSTYLYTPECKCNPGATNLLNITVFPCYKDCTLRPDCEALGIKVANSTSSSGGSDSNKATEFMPGKFQLMTIVMVSVGMILWK